MSADRGVGVGFGGGDGLHDADDLDFPDGESGGVSKVMLAATASARRKRKKHSGPSPYRLAHRLDSFWKSQLQEMQQLKVE